LYRVIGLLREALVLLGQLSPKEEVELVMSQILKLIERGYDQLRIRRLLVGEGLVSPVVFDKAWRESLRYQKRK
jgi:hypothetical protein